MIFLFKNEFTTPENGCDVQGVSIIIITFCFFFLFCVTSSNGGLSYSFITNDEKHDFEIAQNLKKKSSDWS